MESILITITRQEIFSDDVVFRIFEIMSASGMQWLVQKQHGHNTKGAGMGWIETERRFATQSNAITYWENAISLHGITLRLKTPSTMKVTS